MNLCGTCTMCCKLLGIHEIKKPALKWCEHCTPGVGCNVYETRPESCRVYRCMWLSGVEDGQKLMDNLRPDRSKVIFTATTDESIIAVHVDPSFPKAYEKPAIDAIIKSLVTEKRKRVIISTGSGNQKLMLAPGRQKDIIVRQMVTMSDPDENGMQHYKPS